MAPEKAVTFRHGFKGLHRITKKIFFDTFIFQIMNLDVIVLGTNEDYRRGIDSKLKFPVLIIKLHKGILCFSRLGLEVKSLIMNYRQENQDNIRVEQGKESQSDAKRK